MNADKKKILDRIWNESELWKYVHMLSFGSKKEADIFRQKKEEHFRSSTPHLACNWLEYEAEKIADRLCPEFNTWNEYIEYLETFSEEMNEVMYKLDVFDSRMTKQLYPE